VNLDVSGSATLGPKASDMGEYQKKKIWNGFRIVAGLLSAPNITGTISGGGSGSGQVVEDCPGEACAQVSGSGSVKLSGFAGAGVGAQLDKVTGKGFCTQSRAQFNINNDSCWETVQSLIGSAGTRLDVNVVDFTASETFSASSTNSCSNEKTVCGGDVGKIDAVFEYKFEVKVGFFSTDYSDNMTVNLTEGGHFDCSSE